MGLVVRETLPHRAQREIDKNRETRRDIIPFRVSVFKRETFIPKRGSTEFTKGLYELARKIPLLRMITEKAREDWLVEDFSIRMAPEGNVVTLGGVQEESDNGLSLAVPPTERESLTISWKYLNSGLKNGLKVFDRLYPGLRHLRADQGLVGPGLPGRVYLVRHHRVAQCVAVRAGRRRRQAFSALAMERLRQLGAHHRFVALHRLFGALP